MSSWYYSNTRDIHIDLDKIMRDIPTEMLEDELEERKALQERDPARAQRDEDYRSDTVDYEIDIRDYDLVDEEDVGLENFDDCDLKYEIENRGYAVLHDDLLPDYGLGGIAQGLSYFQPWKLKDFLCDFLGISHLSNKEQIINELKTRF